MIIFCLCVLRAKVTCARENRKENSDSSTSVSLQIQGDSALQPSVSIDALDGQLVYQACPIGVLVNRHLQLILVSLVVVAHCREGNSTTWSRHQRCSILAQFLQSAILNSSTLFDKNTIILLSIINIIFFLFFLPDTSSPSMAIDVFGVVLSSPDQLTCNLSS